MKLYLGRYGGCVITGTMPKAVQVSVHCHGHSHEADILPSVDLLKTSMCTLFSMYTTSRKANGAMTHVSNKYLMRMYISMLPLESLREIYKEMDSEPCFRHFYSAALAPLQIDFVSQVPPKVKNLILLMKFWKKTGFEVSIFGFFAYFACISNRHLHKFVAIMTININIHAFLQNNDI